MKTLAMLMVAGSLAVGGGAHAKTLSVCDLVLTGAKLDEHVVRVRATFHTDHYHFAFLEDPHCRGTVDVYTSGSIDRRLSSMTGGYLDSKALTRYEVDVSGQFRWDKNWQPPLLLSAVVPAGPHATLILSRIWSVRPAK